MSSYLGPTERVAAFDVEPGDRLVHQAAAQGWLRVADRALAGDTVVITFADGRQCEHARSVSLWRVPS